jgi:L-iditol 2-dehydrogenase
VAPGEVRIVDLPVPEPGPGEVLVRTIASSICASDFHTIDHGIPGLTNGDGPSDRIGHESVGTVTESRSTRFAAGDRVLIAPTTEYGRTFAEYQAVPDRYLIALPTEPDAVNLLMAQQLGTVIYAMKSFLGSRAPECVVVFGLGPAGLNFVQYLRHLGVDMIVGVDRHAWRLAAAAEMGAWHTIDVTNVEPVSAIEALTGGHFADLVVEAAGSNITRRQAAQSVAHRGRIGFFGIPDGSEPDFAFPFGQVFRRMPTIAMAVNAQDEPGLSSFEEAVRLIAAGAMQPDGLVSHRFELSDIAAALRAARTPEPGVRKVVVDVADQPG